MERKVIIQQKAEQFVKENYIKITFNLIFFALLYLFSRLPYLNIIFSLKTAIYFSLILGLFLYKFTKETLVFISLLFIVLTIPVSILSIRMLADITAMLAYLSFIVATIRSIHED